MNHDRSSSLWSARRAFRGTLRADDHRNRQMPSSGSRPPACAGPTCGPTAALTRSPSLPGGHGYCGIVEEVGRAVISVKPGQFVIGSFFASDNTCLHCQAGYQSSCQHRKFVFLREAPVLRVPLADGTLVATPDVPSEDLIAEPADALRCLGTGWPAEAANPSIMRSQFSRGPRHRSRRPKDRFAAEPSPHGDPSKLEVERLPHRR